MQPKRVKMMDVTCKKVTATRSQVMLKNKLTTAWIDGAVIEDNHDGTFHMPVSIAYEKGLIA